MIPRKFKEDANAHVTAMTRTVAQPSDAIVDGEVIQEDR
jgi:hypothetical protein